jgi:NAD(P)H-hydrate epimerase
VLTPHPGEAGRLLQIATDEVQHDRLSALQKLQNKYHGVIVLKGAGSLVLGSDLKPAICEAGNPGMASAGMGDVLSGVIGGLLGQKIPAFDAAKLAVFIHATAGDMAAKAGGERGMIATDLMPYLRQLVNPEK